MTRFPKMIVIRSERRTNATTCVTRSRLNPNILERAISQDFTVRNTIQRHPTRKAQILDTRFRRERLCHPQHDLFRHGLNRSGNIHVKLR
jgi:hypothetical protein